MSGFGGNHCLVQLSCASCGKMIFGPPSGEPRCWPCADRERAFTEGAIWALAIVGMFEAIRSRESTATRLERLGFERPPPHRMDPFVRPMQFPEEPE